MSSPPGAESAPLETVEQTKPLNHDDQMTETNHDLPARTMDEDPGHDQDHDKDDAATMAASEELKHTSISDRVASKRDGRTAQSDNAEEDKEMEEPVKARTPEPEISEIRDEEMRERISSPKKKRGRDLDDDVRDVESAKTEETASSVDGALNGSRTVRSEPEKKRPRDTSVEPTKTTEISTSLKDAADAQETKPASADMEATNKPKTQATFGSGFSDSKSQTSSSAFASSGFASLAASSSSPFGSLAASKPSVFSSNVQNPTSGFGALAGGKSPNSTTSTITTTTASENKPALGFAFGSGTATGFGGLASGSTFGSGLGNGFAGGSGPKLSSFAAPAKETPIGAKPAKAFGAPDSDEEEGSDEEDSEGGTDTDEEEARRSSPEEKRKTKTIKVEDGESSEATLLQMRAKLFALASKETGWKERGTGTLKVNVPKSCVNYDQNGLPVSGSFDLSGLEEEEGEDSGASRVPRLIMRQDNTHRVILNAAISKLMEFQDKPTTSGAQVIFTAFEGDKDPKPIQMLLRVSEPNAGLFKSEISSIQREL